jgi:TPR repeat protein
VPKARRPQRVPQANKTANWRSLLSSTAVGWAAILAIAFTLAIPNSAHADYVDGLRAFDRGDYSEAVKLWRIGAWREDDLFSQYQLGVLYQNGEYVGQDRIEAAVWFYMAAVNPSRNGITTLALYNTLATKGLSSRRRNALTAPMVPDERTEVKKRVIYIIASMGATGYVRLGELYDSGRWYLRGTPDDDLKDQIHTEFEAQLKKDPNGYASFLKAEAVLEPLRQGFNGAFVQTREEDVLGGRGGPVDAAEAAGGSDTDKKQNAPRSFGIERNDTESLAYYIMAANLGHPIGSLLSENLRLLVKERYKTNATNIFAAAERRAAEWQPPFEQYPSDHSDESKRDSSRAHALARMTEVELKFIQYSLRFLGFYAGGVDNAWGPATFTAMRKYQSSIGERITQPMTSWNNLTPEQNIRLIREAAEQGHAISQNTLGTMYYKGIGEPINYVRARYWFEKSSAQGHNYALFNLGVLYRDGLGVSVDQNQAATYFVAAREKGYPRHSVDRELEKLGWKKSGN